MFLPAQITFNHTCTSYVRQIPERNLQETRENLFPVVKSKIEKFVPMKHKNRQSVKLNSHKNFKPHDTL